MVYIFIIKCLQNTKLEIRKLKRMTRSEFTNRTSLSSVYFHFNKLPVLFRHLTWILSHVKTWTWSLLPQVESSLGIPVSFRWQDEAQKIESKLILHKWSDYCLDFIFQKNKEKKTKMDWMFPNIDYKRAIPISRPSKLCLDYYDFMLSIYSNGSPLWCTSDLRNFTEI